MSRAVNVLLFLICALNEFDLKVARKASYEQMARSLKPENKHSVKTALEKNRANNFREGHSSIEDGNLKENAIQMYRRTLQY